MKSDLFRNGHVAVMAGDIVTGGLPSTRTVMQNGMDGHAAAGRKELLLLACMCVCVCVYVYVGHCICVYVCPEMAGDIVTGGLPSTRTVMQNGMDGHAAARRRELLPLTYVCVCLCVYAHVPVYLCVYVL